MVRVFQDLGELLAFVKVSWFFNCMGSRRSAFLARLVLLYLDSEWM